MKEEELYLISEELEKKYFKNFTSNSKQLKLLIKTNIKLSRLLWKKSEFKEYKDYLRRISNSWKYYKKQKTQYK